MVDVATLALEARTDGLKRAEAALDGVYASAVKTETATEKMSAGFDSAGASATTLAQKIDALVGATNQVGKSAADSAAAFEEHARAADQLRMAYNPLYAASAKYEAALEQINRAEKAGAIGAIEAAQFRQRAANMLDVAADRNVAAMGRVRVAGVQGGTGIQNFGFQVQDLAVQIGAGTSATQALGQQLPQLLSGFGLLGVALGTASAVLIPLAGYLLSSKEQAASLDDAIDNLSDSIGLYEEYITRASETTASLTEKFGVFAGQIKEFSGFMAGVALDEALGSAEEVIAKLNSELSGFEQALANVAMAQEAFNQTSIEVNPEQYLLAKDALELFRANLEQSAADLGLTVDQAQRLAVVLDELAAANGLNEQAAAALRVQGVMQAIRNEAGRLPPQLGDAAKATDQLATLAAGAGMQIAKMPPLLNSTRDAANSAAGAVGGIGMQAAAAVEQAKALATAMNAAAAAARQATAAKWVADQQPGGMGDLANQYKLYGQGKAAADKAAQGTLQFSGATIPAIPSGGGGGGGGGGGAADDGFQSRLDALMEGLQTERDTVDEWYAESMSILNDRRAQELLGAQGHADALVQIEEELQRRKMELRDQDLGHYQSFFGAMAGALQSGGSKMLAISKGFALAEAAVSMWRGAAKALELPFPASLAAWGQVLATGARAISGIKSASFGGGSIGGGSIGSTTAAPVATPDRNIRVNIQGDGMFADALRGSIRQIAEALGDERDIGGFVVA